MKQIIILTLMFLVALTIVYPDTDPGYNATDEDVYDKTINGTTPYPASGTSMADYGWSIANAFSSYTYADAHNGTKIIQWNTNGRGFYTHQNIVTNGTFCSYFYFNGTNKPSRINLGVDVDGTFGGEGSYWGYNAPTSATNWIGDGDSGGCFDCPGDGWTSSDASVPSTDGWIELCTEWDGTQINALYDGIRVYNCSDCTSSYKGFYVLGGTTPGPGVDYVRLWDGQYGDQPVEDIITPIYTGNSSNRSFPFVNDFVNINVTWTEANPAQAWFGNNFTGTWINDTPRSYTSGEDIGNRSQVTEAIDKTVCWQGFANDTNGNFNQTTISCITVTADADPLLTIVSPLNNTIFNQKNTNITYNIGCNDTNLFLLNFTFFNSSNSSLFSVQNSTPTGNNLNLTGTMDISNFGSGDYSGNFSCTDSHTKKKIKGYNIKKDLVKRKITFDTGDNEINVSILTKPSEVNIKKISSKKSLDRYSFEFGSFEEQHSFTILLEAKSDIKRIKNSKYLGHFVSNKNWIDFENEGTISNLDILRRDDKSYWIIITTDNLNFNSIGGLNVVTKTLNYTLDAIAPVITLNTTPANLSYFNTNNTIVFNYTYVESTNVSNCSLIINSIVNQTNPGNDFTATFDDGEHKFNVNCTDWIGNVGESETRIIVVSLTPFSINTNVSYNSDFFTFNTSEAAPANITILPNSTEPFEVCLEDESESSSCINYTGGFFNKTFSWDGIIDWRRYFRFKIDWSKYDNGSDIVTSTIKNQFSSYFNFDNQAPVDFSGNLTTNSNVSYEVNYELEFTSPAFEFEELSHNITFFDSLTNLISTLVYNNTENVIDGTNFSIVGDKTKFVTNFFKNVSKDTTFSFYWNYSFELPNGTTVFFNTSTYSQTIEQLTFNTSCDNPVMNITLSDEGILGLLNSDLKISIERMFFGNDIIILNTSFNLTNISHTEICFNTEDLSQRFDMVFHYDSSGYTPRIYNFLETLTSNVTRTYPLFLSNDGNITNIFITLFDQNSERLRDHYVKADRFYPGSNFYRNIETVKSDIEGEMLLHLIPFLVEYRFRIFNFAGDEVKRVDKTTIKSSTPSITIQTGEAFLEDFDASSSALKSLSFDNDTKEVVWQTTSVFSQSCLAVIRTSSGGETLYDNCQTGTVIVDSYIITENTTDESYEFRGYFLDGSDNVISGEFMSHSEPSNPFRYGMLGILLTLIITVTLFMLGINNPATAITLGFVGLLISAYLKFVILSFGMVILLAIMVGFLLYKMRT